MNEPTDSAGARDATSLRMLGLFFCVLGALVLIGTLWSLDDAAAAVVSVACGAVLLTVGVGMRLVARRMTGDAAKPPK